MVPVRAQPPGGPGGAPPRASGAPGGVSTAAPPPPWRSAPGDTPRSGGIRGAASRAPVGAVPPLPLPGPASQRTAYRTSNRRIHLRQSVAGHAYTTRKEEGVSSA
ncbi:hypothetical protein FHX37_1937 [Haloactinospora alba]|uniref:Uncharacterized protein n=1 Tax=Haloactinospora alba TaxID=405555 RepID=A0A543NJM6_9ACTN|nr:hypothetical protein FHX37_1937 [Haloactinospora alba]